ncbi:hypothetical protein DSO57_1009253 [Entomophthora muscae]|nr:hypothetical protein DSO57_1009253 [Entomophthora muscae]
MIPSWKGTQLTNLKLTRITGALTNSIYAVENLNPPTKGPKKLLLRIYGIGAEQFVDRNKEIAWLSKLSACNVGPKLLGIFGNGRIEEFLESETLTHEDIITKSTSIHIAKRMSDLHNLAKKYPAPSDTVPEFLNCIRSWLPLAKDQYLKMQHLVDSECFPIDFNALEDKISRLEEITLASKAPLVFCHNDAQYGNILRLTSGELVVVDFEYAGYSLAAYDIANHFCEWMANYHSEKPHVLTEAHYPTLTERSTFLRAYLEAQHGSVDELALKKLSQEVERLTLASHLHWGLWGIIQASSSAIEFNYMAYGTQRLSLFLAEFHLRI